MNDIVKQILEWPIIVQGALGSGLFWLILFLGQKMSAFRSKRISGYSRIRRINRLQIESIKLRITLEEQPHRASLFGLLLFRALGRITRGLVWLALGLAFQSVIPIFGIVGYVGALFYFFNALQIFKPLDSEIDKEKRIDEIDSEISELEKHNKKIQPTADATAD